MVITQKVLSVLYVLCAICVFIGNMATQLNKFVIGSWIAMAGIFGFLYISGK